MSKGNYRSMFHLKFRFKILKSQRCVRLSGETFQTHNAHTEQLLCFIQGNFTTYFKIINFAFLFSFVFFQPKTRKSIYLIIIAGRLFKNCLKQHHLNTLKATGSTRPVVKWSFNMSWLLSLGSSSCPVNYIDSISEGL